MTDEIHIFECGVDDNGTVCHFSERRVSKEAADFALEMHIRIRHNRRFDPDRPSSVIMGWVFPDHQAAMRRARGNGNETITFPK